MMSNYKKLGAWQSRLRFRERCINIRRVETWSEGDMDKCRGSEG